MRTTPEEYAQLLANQKRVSHKQVKLDHIPSVQEILALQLRERSVEIETEYPFHPRRKWRADIFVPEKNLLIEVDGNGTGGHPGRHRSIDGVENDNERDAEALFLGYITLRVTTRQVRNGKALSFVERLLGRLAGEEDDG